MGAHRAALLLAFAAIGCSSSPASAPSPSRDASAPSAAVRMDFTRPDFYAAPFPSDDLRAASGAIALTGFPNPTNADLANQALALIQRDARGFATTAGIFFALTGPIDPSKLPSLAESVAAGAPVALVNVDVGSPEYLRSTPVHVAFESDGGPFGAPSLLSLVPLQGTPLRPSTTYAALVLREATNPPLDVAPAMASLIQSQKPAGMSDAAFATYERAIGALNADLVARAAAMTVFTTDAPLDGMTKVVTDVLARPRPAPGTFSLTDTFPDFCVYATTIAMPDYQSGTPPFTSAGGDWTFDAAGKPILQRTDPSRLVVTVPRKPMPAAGWPSAVFIRTGAGGDRPLVDRGTQGKTGGPALVPGTGPALEFARAGWAGVQVDGPLGGLRNPTNANEDFTVFNVFNAGALRDNVRESAVELVLLSHVLDAIAIDASSCAGATSSVKLDPAEEAIFGHSMGASILPLAFAFEPRYRAAILSGAGGSWIENVMRKQQPLQVKGALELFLGYKTLGRELSDHDPILTLFQWAAEPADAQVYAPRILRQPMNDGPARHVLMVQGIVDHYILPPIANALSAPLGLDLVGPELDATNPETQSMPTLASMFPFSGQSAIAYPAQGNSSSFGTAVVVQAPGDGVEDGHEVIFQTAPPKYQYKCFLASLLAGSPKVLDGAGKTDDAPCE